MVVLLFFIDSPVVPSKKTLCFASFYNGEAMFLTWHYVILSPNKIYFSFFGLV